MIRKFTPIIILFFIICITAYALTSQHDRADFTYVNPSGIHTLDPARMSWMQDFRVSLNIWEGLTSWHPQTTKPIEGAAHFPPDISDDGLIYTFTIRNDARWSNGDRVTAHDFIRGWRRGMEPGAATDYTFLFTDHITGAEDYVRWRRDTVALLAPLSRLKDGWAISVTQAKQFVNAIGKRETFPSLDVEQTLTRISLIAPESDQSDEDWEHFVKQLALTPVNYKQFHQEIFEQHTSQIDERFQRVGIKAIDDVTLVVHLTQPCPYFLDLTAFPIFLPIHKSIESLRQRYDNAPITSEGLVIYDPQWTKPIPQSDDYPGIITNGPYQLADWTFKRRARLTVNPYYRNASAIRCRTVDMQVFENINASIMAYEAGDVDFLPSLAVTYDHEIARLSRTGERKDFKQCIVLATYFLNFNCVSESISGRINPFVDARVRKAFALAVDKEKIVDRVLQRGDRPAYSFVPPDAIPGYTPPTGLSRNVEQARKLLAEAGYPSGQDMPTIEFLYTPNDERVAQALAHEWEKSLGVHIELQSKESRTFAEDKANFRYMIARGNWYADYNDPTTFLNCLISGNGNNDSGYANSKYDQLLEKANRAATPARRAEILQQAEKIIVEQDFPILPILHYAEPIAIKPYVKGLYPNARLWFPFQYVSIER